MPIYEYRCQNCQEVFEVRQKFSDEPIATHSCGGQGQRLLSTPQFHFKGSGFYITDYRSESYKKAAKQESSSTGDKAGSKPGGEGKTEAKPAPATAKKTEPPKGKGS